MSAVNRPNMNFDNEHKVHVPYSKIMAGELKSAYERFRKPKSGKAAPRKTKVTKNTESVADATIFKKWFD
ncbi:MAG TPA: hypothetical protein DEF82_02795 [Crocinitomicaceae bacterium]|nr:hypothetical protein [Crocinitomicaceae bacterium]